MSITPAEARTGLAQTGDGAVQAAHAEREARLAADVATMQAGPTQHEANMTSFHQGQPTVETQMVSHVAPPHTPDVGGHSSATDPIR